MIESFEQQALDSFYLENKRRVEFSRDDWKRLQPCMKVMKVDAQCLLQEAGSPVSYHYFIVSGLIRNFYTSPEGKEHNKSFYQENYIAGNFSAVLQNAPSRFSIETLTPCTLIQYPINQLKIVCEKSLGWERLFNCCCQLMLIRNERREAELLTLSARERYLLLLKNLPDIHNQIRQYHIASYLGITPEALSKHKKQWLKTQSL